MAKARTYPIVKIDTNQFTNLMIMELKVALEKYLYLKNEFPSFKTRPYSDNDDFVIEYFDFYALKAALGDFTKPIVKRTYFEMLKHTSTINPLIAVEEFKNALPEDVTIGNHISFCSKMCHTINNTVPIYDSRVGEYLHKIYQTPDNFEGVHNWYYSVDPETIEDKNQLLTWFRNHPQLRGYTEVNDIKVLDTIIFIWHKYH